MDASGYKNVILGLIFLKYISERFDEKYQKLINEGEDFEEDVDEYTSEGIFFVPLGARWNEIKVKVHILEIGTVIDDAMRAIEKENKRLKDILGRTYEYCLQMFAEQEGKRGDEFFTPTCVIRTLVEVLQPYKGRVYDPCCASGGIFVELAKFVKNHSVGVDRNRTGRKIP